jgi:hypothetical protein
MRSNRDSCEWKPMMKGSPHPWDRVEIKQYNKDEVRIGTYRLLPYGWKPSLTLWRPIVDRK